MSFVKLLKSGRKGFTLIELIVVISIIGVLAAIVVPVVTQHLGQSQEESYKAELNIVQKLIDQYHVAQDNTKFQGRRQFPILGAAKGGGTFYTADANASADIVVITGNPNGGTEGGSPSWIDDGDGARGAGEEDLNDEDAVGTEVGWHVVQVDVSGTTYYIDSRDFIIDFDLLLNTVGDDGLLRKPPESAAADSCSTSSCDGSYIYFVDSAGNVQTLLASFPRADKTGFQEGVFP